MSTVNNPFSKTFTLAYYSLWPFKKTWRNNNGILLQGPAGSEGRLLVYMGSFNQSESWVGLLFSLTMCSPLLTAHHTERITWFSMNLNDFSTSSPTDYLWVILYSVYLYLRIRWQFSPTFAEEIFAYFILVGLENKVRHRSGLAKFTGATNLELVFD